MPFEIDRGLYARLYGPTTGDRVRPGDTNLWVEVERDHASPGDETLWGFGKTIRDAMQMTGHATGPELGAPVAVSSEAQGPGGDA